MHTVQWTCEHERPFKPGKHVFFPWRHVSMGAEPWQDTAVTPDQITRCSLSHGWQAKCVMKLWRCKCVAVGEKMWEALKSFESENQIDIDKLCDIRNHEKSQIRYSIESIDIYIYTSSENVYGQPPVALALRLWHRASRIWQVRLKDKLEANEELRYGAFQRDSTWIPPGAEGEDMVVSYIKKKYISV